MSATLITEQRPPRPASVDQRGLSASRQWSVLANSDLKALMLLDAFKGIRRGAVYRTPAGEVVNQFCLCQGVTAVGKPPAAGSGLGQYICTAEYSTEQTPLAAQPGGRTVWSIRSNQTTEQRNVDNAGNLITTSSLEPVDPAPSVLVPEEILHGEFYVPGPDEITAYKIFRPFNNTINLRAHAKLGANPGELLIHVFQTEGFDTGWVKLTVDIQFRRSYRINGVYVQGWQDYFIDQGFYQVSSAGVRSRITIDGELLSTPWPLNGRGVAFTRLEVAAGRKAVPRVVTNYLYSDFSRIPFP